MSRLGQRIDLMESQSHVNKIQKMNALNQMKQIIEKANLDMI